MKLTNKAAQISKQDLFLRLFNAGTESELQNIINKYSSIFANNKNWSPLGGNESNFGVIENQQSSPIAALIEKVTNSIDAILMKYCLEKQIDPRSKKSPKSVKEAIDLFFPNHVRDWNLPTFRKKQAEDLQIVASGKPRDTSVIIYDNGEGQHPNKFEDTFLSLLKGNKNEIHFVQGKYNMGGSGAIVFCGKKGYQLIGSRKYDKSGDFGFTLIRQHPLSESESKIKKNTWYEYLKIDKKIPSFPIKTLDIGLHNRVFETGSIIKMYSYQFPKGYSGFAQDLNQSINEFLFDPALPIYTIDNKERYPNNKVLKLDLYGLKRRLENDKDYLEDSFSVNYTDDSIGKMKATCYVFKAKVKGNDVKKTKAIIRKRYFKNNMSVLFSMNGQVHGHYTSEFITRTLKKNILKDYVLIHVDCTEMNYDFRKELFMASRDRLKNGDETRHLRSFLGGKLSSKNSRLTEIEKERKNNISVSSQGTNNLLKDFTKNLPINSDIRKLLGNTFKLDDAVKKKSTRKSTKKGIKREILKFNPQRFPSFLKLKAKNDGETPVAKIPLGGEKTLKFETDVEDRYFDRVEEPGELKIALLNHEKNEKSGGNALGKPNAIEDILNVETTSPKKGVIKVVLSPKKDVAVGDEIQVKVTLTEKSENYDQIFWVKISEKEKENKKVQEKEDETTIGLPEPIFAYKDKKEGRVSWEEIEQSGKEIDYSTVMIPDVSGDNLERIFINMDSNVFKRFKSQFKNPSEEQLNIAERKYFSSVYFHTLFLYTITKKRNYSFQKTKEGKEQSIDIEEYLSDLFSNHYSEFILNFGSMDLLESLG